MAVINKKRIFSPAFLSNQVAVDFVSKLKNYVVAEKEL